MNILMKIASGITGRILFVVPMVMFGINHLTKAETMAGMVPLPGGIIWVYLTGIFLLAGAAGIVTNLKDKGQLAAFLTGIMLLGFAFMIHLPGMVGEGGMMSMISFLKDIGLAGGAFVIAGTFKN